MRGEDVSHFKDRWNHLLGGSGLAMVVAGMLLLLILRLWPNAPQRITWITVPAITAFAIWVLIDLILVVIAAKRLFFPIVGPDQNPSRDGQDAERGD